MERFTANVLKFLVYYSAFLFNENVKLIRFKLLCQNIHYNAQQNGMCQECG